MKLIVQKPARSTLRRQFESRPMKIDLSVRQTNGLDWGDFETLPVQLRKAF
jgi:hypothetical protein